MKTNPAALLVGATAVIALFVASRASGSTPSDPFAGGGGGATPLPENPDSPNSVPPSDREVRGYSVIGYDTGNLQAARVAFAGDVAPVAIAFRIGPSSDNGARAVQFAAFAMGRANNMTTAERLAVSKYLETGAITDQASLSAGIAKATSAWRNVVTQAKQGTNGTFTNLSDFDQEAIQVRVMYMLGYISKDTFDKIAKQVSLTPVLSLDWTNAIAMERARFIAESSAVLAKYKVALTGGVGEKAMLYLGLVLNYTSLSSSSSKTLIDQANKATLSPAPSIGTSARAGLIAVKDVLLRSAGA